MGMAALALSRRICLLGEPAALVSQPGKPMAIRRAQSATISSFEVVRADTISRGRQRRTQRTASVVRRYVRLSVSRLYAAAVVDVTPINRHRNRHHFLRDEPEFLDELYQRLLRPMEPISRRLYPAREKAGVVAWILWDE